MYSKSIDKKNSTIATYGLKDKVRVVTSNGSYQITFGKRSKIDGDTRKFLSFNQNQLEAHRIAKELSHHLDTNKVTLNDLKPLSNDKIIELFTNTEKLPNLTIIQSIKDNSDNRSIKDIFFNFVNSVSSTRAKNTLKEYKETEVFLNQLSKCDCLLSNIKNLGNIALKTKTRSGTIYALSSLKKRFKNINTSLNFNNIKLDFNLIDLLPKLKKNDTVYFNKQQVKDILEYFYHNDNYYYPYVFTLAYTGMRPEEAIALRIKDLKINSNGIVQISIFKAYTNSELRHHTKTYKDRIIPCSKALSSFLIKYTNGKNKDDLLFPSIKNNTYLIQQNFNTRHFKKALKVLNFVDLNIDDYSTYNLRHSFATNLLRQGKDIATIASLLGDRIQTVIDNYIGSDYENTDIPDIY